MPRSSNTGLIVGVVLGVLLLIVGGGVGVWALTSGDEGSTTASGGNGGASDSDHGGVVSADPKEEAAKDLRYSYSLYSPKTISAYCEAAFAFGEGMIFQVKSDCVSALKNLKDAPDATVREYAGITVTASDFQETQDGTLSVLEDDLYPEGSNYAKYADSQPTHSVLVLKDITGNNDWRIIGLAYGYQTSGTVPADAKDLMYKGG